MQSLDRREFLKRSLLTGAALSLAGSAAGAQPARTAPAGSAGSAPGIIDTNINLFEWPFRKLKYRDTAALVAKLKRHRVVEAWAGSFEALLHKDIAGVNRRLAQECQEKGEGILRPFGSVNLAWPDWEEDVRRCHEVHRMSGIRLYPGYQPFGLDHPDLERLLRITAERGLLVQIVFDMEDPRVHHPILNLNRPLSAPLIETLQRVPEAKVQLLHYTGNVQGADLHQFMTQTSACLDISRLEGNGMVGQLAGVGPSVTSARVPVERLLFGSHVPYFPLETALLKLMESPFDANQLFAIMRGNARRLLAPA